MRHDSRRTLRGRRVQNGKRYVERRNYMVVWLVAATLISRQGEETDHSRPER